MSQELDYLSFKQVLEKSYTITASSLAAILLFTFVIYSHTEAIYALGWLAFMVTQQLIRQAYSSFLLQDLEDLKDNLDKFKRRYHYLIVLTGSGWAALAPLYISSGSDPIVLMYVTIFIIGMTAGSIFSLATVPSYYFTFTALLAVPSISAFVLIEYYYLATVTLVFFLFAFKSSMDVLSSAKNNLQLNLKNAALIEDLKSANNLKSEFLANMSHEIRTPMNAILGFIDLVQDGETDAGKLQYFNTITNSGKDLLQIIDDILDFSKIESNQLAIESIAFNVKKRISQTVELFNTQAAIKGIQIELTFNENMPDNIKSDPTRIIQMVNNLLSNAIKFSDENTTIKVDVNYHKKNKELEIKVTDQGIGISQEKLEHIFEPFTQADNSTTREFGGTGLGLSICAALAKKLNGRIEVKSKLQKGSVFTLHIYAPIIKYKVEEKRQFQDEIELNGKLLIVEDNETNQLLITKLAEKVGLNYDLAKDGREAIEMFNSNIYDLVLMDENMPNMNGIQATAKIREIEAREGLKAIPIIAVTANSLKEDRARFIKAGMDDYLSKPINVPLFYKMLNKYLH